MNSSFLITSKQDGVYLGDFLGLAFWSNIDPANLTEAPVFSKKEDALQFLSSWNTKPNDIEIVPVMTSNPNIATIEEISMSGIKPWASN